jgi:predicted Zn-dependent protease with MMP-like domain
MEKAGQDAPFAGGLPMIAVSDQEFDGIVQKAIGRIPEEIRQYLDNLMISVRKRPARKMMKEMGFEDANELLGIFQGVPLTERSVTSPTLFPDAILLFQEPLQEMCQTIDELEEQIEITIVHEIAHFIGMDEMRLFDLGYE